MKEKKYYCLMLSNCYDTAYHYVSLGLHSVMKNVLRKEYTDLSTVKDDFMDLDDTITELDNHWLVKGSFPVIATEIAPGKMLDCVSGLIISSPDKALSNELIYLKRTKADTRMAELLLTLIDKENKERYYQEQIKLINLCKLKYLEEENISLTHVRTNFTNSPVIGVVKMDDMMISYETGIPLYPAQRNTITKHLTYIKGKVKNQDILKNGPITVAKIPDINFIKEESIKRYNNYIQDNQDKSYEEIFTKKKVKISK